MSKKLAAIALALGILTSAMCLKTILGSDHAGTTVMAANGPAPMPLPPPPPPNGGTK
jgi:hypothetical protein